MSETPGMLKVRLPCKLCKQVVEVEFDPECPQESLDIFSKWFTCDPCMRSERRMQNDTHAARPRTERPVHHGQSKVEEQTGLPYHDD